MAVAVAAVAAEQASSVLDRMMAYIRSLVGWLD